METIAVDIDNVLAPDGCRELYPDTAPSLYQLRERFNLEVVTARNPRRVAETMGWLALDLAGVFSGVHFIRAYKGETVTKADVCREIGADYLIDDLLEHCQSVASIGATALLFGSYPQIYIPNIHPVQGWGEVIDYFSEK